MRVHIYSENLRYHFIFGIFFTRKVKSFYLIIFLLFICGVSIAQKFKAAIEINPFFRMDWYPEFSYKTGDVNRDHINMRGASWGIDVAYKTPLNNNFSVKAGIGYYRYTFNKIEHFNTTFGNNNKRTIFYPSSYYLLFATDGYYYNTISINVSFEKHLIIQNKLEINTGLNLSNHITYSQYYHIPVDYPVGPKNGRYVRKNIHYFGVSGSAYFSFLKKIGSAQIGPSVLIPIYDTWKQDNIFPEEANSGLRSKWSRGFGVGIVFIIPLTFNN